MPPIGVSYSIWAADRDDYDSPELLLDCLLPTGVIVQLQVQKEDQLSTIKESLWSVAKNYPLYSMLGSRDEYMFVCINEMAVKVELEDEKQRLSDVRPFQPMLKLVKVVKSNNTLERVSRDEKLLQAQISVLLGKRVDELAAIPSSEVVDFRKHMHEMCQRIAKERDSQDWLQRAMCFYPPDISNDPTLPPHLVSLLDEKGSLLLLVHMDNAAHTVQVPIESMYPEQLVQRVIELRSKKTGIAADNMEEYVLRVLGRDEYFLGNYPLCQFKYIRRMMTKSEKPELLIVSKDSLLDEIKPSVPQTTRSIRPHQVPPAPLAPQVVMRNPAGTCLLDLTEPFSITLVNVSNINIQDFSMVNVRASVYHGGDNLCAVISSPERRIMDHGMIEWNEVINFELSLQNLPRMARLCFMLYTSGDRRNAKTGGRGARIPTGGGKRVGDGKKDVIPLAWVNIPVFDYKGILRYGEYKLHMWPVADEDILSEELLNPIGTVESNSHMADAACLTISFHKYNQKLPIYYPPFDKVLEIAAKYTPNFDDPGRSNEDDEMNIKVRRLVMDPTKVTRQHLEVLRVMIDRDPLHVNHEQDKELIWSLRYECREHFPHSLPKVLTCVHWDNYINVAMMQMLLQIWSPLKPTEALELLDFQYADSSVRKFAVSCLKEMSDSELSQYLLQFVQALKYESYLECDLIEFLLYRALKNQKIGHHLFWLLRSEMHVPSVSVRFGLILEAYCRGNVHHLAPLTKQAEAVRRLGQVADIIKKLPLNQGKLREELVKILKNSLYKEALSMFSCPLDSGLKLKDLDVTKCKSMDSKMRPLWLVWDNNVAGSLNLQSYIMFKRGDDLRQDMLSLQMLHIMDNLWQAEGLDLRLSAYGCLATGQNEGLIEIVTQSTTIANIKLDLGFAMTSAFNKQCILGWLQKHNKTEQSLRKAVEEFLLSCAGYCVATYVLGVADRHADNIMIKQNGQLFHIDFGHILGHFKSKLGIKRERVPFVLTNDFVYVIRRGKANDDKNFDRFRNICEQAFLILRKNSNFLIALFLMMMNTGIPEVSSLKDVEYLKETLVPHFSDEEAIAHFRSKFREALHYSWKADVNNVFHLIRVGGGN